MEKKANKSKGLNASVHAEAALMAVAYAIANGANGANGDKWDVESLKVSLNRTSHLQGVRQSHSTWFSFSLWRVHSRWA